MSSLTRLTRVYDRQSSDLAPMRRHLWSLIPIRRLRRLVIPGCGTGHPAFDLERIRRDDSDIILMDRDPAILAVCRSRLSSPGTMVVCADALDGLPGCDLVATSFMLYQQRHPEQLLEAFRHALEPEGYWACAGEYLYDRMTEEPSTGLTAELMRTMRKRGWNPELAGRLEEMSVRAGFRVVESGVVEGLPSPPDRDWLTLELGEDHPLLPGMHEDEVRIRLPVFWGLLAVDH